MDLIIFIGILALFFLALLLLPIEVLCFRARKYGAKFSRRDAAGLLARKSTKKVLLQAIGTCQQNGLNLTTEKLETHYLAGGNPKQVVDSLIKAKEKGIDISFQQLSAIDLMGKDTDQILEKGYEICTIHLPDYSINNIKLDYTARFKYGLAVAFKEISEKDIEEKVKERLTTFARSWDSKDAIKTQKFLLENILNTEYWENTLRVILVEQKMKILAIT